MREAGSLRCIFSDGVPLMRQISTSKSEETENMNVVVSRSEKNVIHITEILATLVRKWRVETTKSLTLGILSV